MTQGTRMRFGLQLGQERVSWPELLRMYELGEELGFHSLWAHDHFIPADPGRRQGPCLEGWTVLAAAAMRVSRSRLGVLVSGVTYRHPAVLAKEAVTLDHISGGRLELGIGAAWYAEEHRAYGIPFPPVKERMDRLEEAVQLIKMLFTREHSTFTGRYYQLEDAPFDPPPLQKPHPPIWIGGGGRRRTLRIVAKYADAWNGFGGPDRAREQVAILEEHCRAVGRDPAEIRKTIEVPVFTGPPEEVERLVQERVRSFGITPQEARGSILMGSPEELRETVRRYAAAGISEIILALRTPYDVEGLRAFSREVVAAFA